MIGIISASLAPGLALLVFFYLKDRFDTEPFSLVFKSFVFGLLLVFPIMFIQYAFMAEGVGQSVWFQSFFLSGVLEEFFKWFIFLYVVYKHVSFDNHYDGIVYGVAISLGFASLENLLYLIANGIEHAFGRAIFPVSSHALFGVIMGYYIGKTKFAIHKPKRSLLIALLLPAFLHGLYDFILVSIESYWLYIMAPFMLFLWMFALRKVKVANHHLPTEETVIPIDTKNNSAVN
ncbi:glutamic-type intramembrane protease PrsW [Salirhabdus sp. Marseille-P4669]|uniref:glutamic-type intramembrane protease PrsW n=1 Tax=Salirhabdus sp. Marseille-P4669 TaxID=2042310 RepID=UPI000C7AA74D|nr:glutamic-type intramembrane protease PrsW [Salirhabdus sp. Marseille-P4669]